MDTTTNDNSSSARQSIESPRKSPKAPSIQVTRIVHPDDKYDEFDDDQDNVNISNDFIVPTIGIDNPIFEFNDNVAFDDDDHMSLRTGYDENTRMLLSEGDDVFTSLPTPLPFNRGANSNIFVFDPDSTSINSRRGSYSIENVTTKLPLSKFPRRGSYGPTVSDKSSLTVPTMRQIRSGESIYESQGLKPNYADNGSGHMHVPPASPGMLSTNSAWDELLKLGTSRKSSDAGLSDYSRSNSLSISNVSSSLSEHLRYLVRAFSSRTERVKETTIQPPSPSSLSEYAGSECLSAISTEPQVRHRLDSFFPDPPEGDTISEIVRFREEEESEKKKRFKIPRWIRKLKFPHVIEPQSKLYLIWLFIVTVAFMYNAWAIPLRAVFPYQTVTNVHYWMVIDYLCDLVYIVDILLFKMRITFLNQGLKETHRKATRANYMKKRIFKYDCLSLIPLDLFYLVNMKVNPWLRLPRLLKIQTFWEFYSRCDHLMRSAHAVRIIKTMTYMLFLIHVETCGYYAMSVYEGFDANKWVYNGEGNAYIRCFYLATKTATSIGNNPKPTNVQEYMFMTVYWVSGVFVFALLIGQIRDIVDAATLVKRVYTQRMDSALYYMKSMNISPESDIEKRVRTWFIYNWEQQKIIDEQKLMDTLPMKLRKDLAIHVHFNTLSKVKLFQDCDKTLLYDLVLKLKPVLILPGDYVCKKGEIGKEMYIVSQGIVEVVGGPNNSLVLATLREGSVFGEISLLAMAADGNRRTADVRCKGFTNLFILSKVDFESAMKDYPDAHALLKKRAKRLLRLNARIERKSQCSLDASKIKADNIIKTPPDTPKMVKTVIQIMNPDSAVIKHISAKSSDETLNISDKHVPDITHDNHGNDNIAYEPGSEYNISSTAAPTKEEVEAMFDEILTVHDWSDVNEDAQHETTIPLRADDPTDATTIIDIGQGSNPEGKTKKTSDSSHSSTDSGVQDTKNGSPAPSTSRTISNKDSKESFNSTELGDILEDPDSIDEEPTLDGINYTADMFGDIERRSKSNDVNKTTPSIDISRTPTTHSLSDSRRSDVVDIKGNEYAQALANGFKITIESVDDCAPFTRNEFSPVIDFEEKKVSVIGKTDVSKIESNNVTQTLMLNTNKDIRGSFESLISPDNTTRTEFVFNTKGSAKGNKVKPASAANLRKNSGNPTTGNVTKKQSTDKDKKPKTPQQKIKPALKLHIPTKNNTSVSPHTKQLPKTKLASNKFKPPNKVAAVHVIDESYKLTNHSPVELNKIKTENTKSKLSQEETSNDPLVELEMDELNFITRSITVAKASVTDTVINIMPSSLSIPNENKVTCVAEVHREKTLSPKSVRSDSLSVSQCLGDPEAQARQRKISVISIGSVLKDGKETLV